eukprot:10944670-Lingulodinium_polyedra.AAC.1
MVGQASRDVVQNQALPEQTIFYLVEDPAPQFSALARDEIVGREEGEEVSYVALFEDDACSNILV